MEEKVEERTRELLRSNEILREEIQEKNEARAALEKSQIRYMGLFEHLPVAIIEADYSQLKQILDSLPFDIQGDAFSDYAETHPDFVRLCFDSIQVIGVNQETVNLLRVESADAVYKNWKLFLVRITSRFSGEFCGRFVKNLIFTKSKSILGFTTIRG
ncbi:hypothetical protein LEP1GSC016_1802 [Leptospira borgpetersenii serovar Hardjo-bovis str. Sponselee]|uniref:PAS domain-containing protein n=1 Tax=Leptospira borgpetersenii serovar Hardjo-bovis str. Sponselee TaxID=1303729 RepID=M6C5Y7_LEPBO|nr:hypothetical protein LEP1GSC016_1802 [Leptospira borgpetersenii serovar Hardjo-bovis str. Sponselee]